MLAAPHREFALSFAQSRVEYSLDLIRLSAVDQLSDVFRVRAVPPANAAISPVDAHRELMEAVWLPV